MHLIHHISSNPTRIFFSEKTNLSRGLERRTEKYDSICLVARQQRHQASMRLPLANLRPRHCQCCHTPMPPSQHTFYLRVIFLFTSLAPTRAQSIFFSLIFFPFFARFQFITLLCSESVYIFYILQFPRTIISFF